MDEGEVLVDLANYKSKEAAFSREFMWNKKALDKMAPKIWWTATAPKTELSSLAAKIVSLPPTSAAVERSFSAHSWIHSKKRNRLTNERAAKLVFINHNYQINRRRTSISTMKSGMEDRAPTPSPLTSKDTGHRAIHGHADIDSDLESEDSEIESDSELQVLCQSDSE